MYDALDRLSHVQHCMFHGKAHEIHDLFWHGARCDSLGSEPHFGVIHSSRYDSSEHMEAKSGFKYKHGALKLAGADRDDSTGAEKFKDKYDRIRGGVTDSL
ncbi:unnamed protein product, partial [Prorocentrum cordatum]